MGYYQQVTEESTALAKVIRTRRESLGLTQLELGQLVGCDSRAISRWESGVPLSIDRLRKLAKVFKTTAGTLLVESEPK